jgi:hypothetical protein
MTLLGNIWAQEWGNIYDVVAPPKSSTVNTAVFSRCTAVSRMCTDVCTPGAQLTFMKGNTPEDGIRSGRRLTPACGPASVRGFSRASAPDFPRLCHNFALMQALNTGHGIA